MLLFLSRMFYLLFSQMTLSYLLEFISDGPLGERPSLTTLSKERPPLFSILSLLLLHSTYHNMQFFQWSVSLLFVSIISFTSGEMECCIHQQFSSVWIPINIFLFLSLRVGSSLTPKHASLDVTLGSHLQPLWSEFFLYNKKVGELVHSGLVAEIQAKILPLSTQRTFMNRKLTGRKIFPSWLPCLNDFVIVLSLASV